jgi:hypothetical protein
MSMGDLSIFCHLLGFLSSMVIVFIVEVIDLGRIIHGDFIMVYDLFDMLLNFNLLVVY